MLGKPTNRLQGLCELFTLAVWNPAKAVATCLADKTKEIAIYNLDLEGNASWTDVRQKISNGIFDKNPSHRI